MRDDDPLLAAMRAIVAGVVGARRALPADMGANTPLAEGGLWLDSLELLEVIVACEVEFGIIFEPAKDLLGDGLETLETLAALVRAKNPRLSRV